MWRDTGCFWVIENVPFLVTMLFDLIILYNSRIFCELFQLFNVVQSISMAKRYYNIYKPSFMRHHIHYHFHKGVPLRGVTIPLVLTDPCFQYSYQFDFQAKGFSPE